MSNGQDAVNFRHMKESHSLHLEDQTPGTAGYSHVDTPGADDGLEMTAENGDLFGAFNSVTLHYDGETYT
jgi:protein-serine/threonine kinase